MSINARTSTGIPLNLTGDKLTLMTALTQKCSSSFPPAFTNNSYEGNVETELGNKALEKGRWAYSRRKPAPKDSGSSGKLNPGFPSREEIDNELGGIDGFFTLFGLHYCNMFANPRMYVLFDTRKSDSAVNALEHGKRIACTLLDEMHNTSYFQALNRGFSGAFAVMGTHAHAKLCPMRPKSQQIATPTGHRKANRRFTTKQRDTWVGSIMCAAEECQCSKAFEEKFGLWLAMTVSAYAPFIDEDTGVLDWMEESKYG